MVETIAEFTTNHMGNLNVLLRMVDRAAAAGASWIKMQGKDVESYYTEEKLAAPYDSPYGKTYRDYRTVFEFDEDDFERFDARCKARNIRWFSTIQDMRSLDSMLRWNLPRYKVASSNARNRDFLNEVAERVPEECEVVVSVGGSTLEQIAQAVRIFDGHRRVWLLHCVAEYPCPPSRIRLGNISELRRRFECDRVRIGYSGHEEGYLPSLTAVKLGAEMVERHFCLSRHSFVHHIECSLEPDEFAAMANHIRAGTFPDGAVLTSDALRCDFGMSDAEERFLVQQTYGNKYLGELSAF